MLRLVDQNLGWVARVAAVAMSVAGVAYGACPPSGKQPLNQQIVTDAGTYDVWVYRGEVTEEIEGGEDYCVDAGFIPFPGGPVIAASNGDHFLTGEFSVGVLRVPASAYECESGCDTVEDLREYIEFPASTTHPPFFLELGLGSPWGSPHQTKGTAWVVGGTASPGSAPGRNRVWTPQAGFVGRFPTATVWTGTHSIPVKAWENHSRLVSYETETETLEVFNLPGDWNQVLTPLWDASRNRLWFLESGVDFNHPRVGHFDPDQVSSVVINDTEDFQNPLPLDSAICRGQDEDTCIEYVDLPVIDFFAYTQELDAASTRGVQMPISMVTDNDDHIWVAGFVSNNLLSLDMETGDIDIYPLAVDPADELECPIPVSRCGRGPALMAVDDEGLLYVTEFWSGKIGVIDTTTAPGNATCKTLDNEGLNPCVFEYDIRAAFDLQHPEYPSVSWALSGILVDPSGIVWFGGGGSDVPAPLAGYIKPDVTPSIDDVVFLPPLDEPDLYFRDSNGDLHLRGRSLPSISLASNGADLWFGDRFGNKVFLFKKVIEE